MGRGVEEWGYLWWGVRVSGRETVTGETHHYPRLAVQARRSLCGYVGDE